MKKLLLIITMLNILNVSSAQPENKLPSWAFGTFERPKNANPLIEPNEASTFNCPMTQKRITWEFADTFNPAAVVKDGKIHVLYRAEDNPKAGIGGRTSRIGHGISSDGIHIDTRDSVPVMYPDECYISKKYEWNGGCEDPRVVAAINNGRTIYVMTYTSWNYKCPRLSIATSYDLKHWTKYGPAFGRAYGGKFKDMVCKSGSIVTKVINGVQQAIKVPINGKEQYLMYWGEQWICAATSDDLITWTPIVDNQKELRYLIKPRKGHFDSMLTECGPPAIMTDNGIIVFYNGKNSPDSNGDKKYAANTYAAGQVLFDKNDPLKVLDRLDKPFFYPTTSFERSGQYAAGTVFIEGLVYFQSKWFLYYGCADSKVGVAIYNPSDQKSK